MCHNDVFFIKIDQSMTTRREKKKKKKKKTTIDRRLLFVVVISCTYLLVQIIIHMYLVLFVNSKKALKTWRKAMDYAADDAAASTNCHKWYLHLLLQLATCTCLDNMGI